MLYENAYSSAHAGTARISSARAAITAIPDFAFFLMISLRFISILSFGNKCQSFVPFPIRRIRSFISHPAIARTPALIPVITAISTIIQRTVAPAD